MEHSQVMRTLHMLTDRYGPRLTGSPNYEAAANWVVKQLTEWGFQNVHLEPWDFGHPGWMNEHAYGLMTSPVRDNLTFEVLAWTPSTKGVVRGNAVQVAPAADAHAGTDDRVPDGERKQGQGQDRAGGQSGGGAGQLQSRGDAARRQAGQGTVRPEQSECRTRRIRPRPRRPCGGARQVDGGAGQHAGGRVAGGEQGAAADQRCGARTRTDPRLPQPDLRSGESAAYGSAAQRGLRPHRSPAGGR